jgi:hypothetical protein
VLLLLLAEVAVLLAAVAAVVAAALALRPFRLLGLSGV